MRAAAHTELTHRPRPISACNTLAIDVMQFAERYMPKLAFNSRCVHVTVTCVVHDAGHTSNRHGACRCNVDAMYGLRVEHAYDHRCGISVYRSASCERGFSAHRN